MGKTLTVERCKISGDLARKYNLGDNNYPAHIIFDPELSGKRIEKAPGMYEAKCEEIRTQNAEIDERNEVGKANVEKRNKKCILTGCAIGILCFVVVVTVFRFILNDPFVWYVVGTLFGLAPAAVYIYNVGLEEFTPEEHIKYPDSVESFYTINEFFTKWWQEDFTMLELCYWVYSGLGQYKYELSLLAADKDDVIHEAEFKFDASPEIVIKRNQSCIEFDLINNRITLPYVAKA